MQVNQRNVNQTFDLVSIVKVFLKHLLGVEEILERFVENLHVVFDIAIQVVGLNQDHPSDAQLLLGGSEDL